MTKRSVLAVDLGAESGRVMAVHFDGSRLALEELHRFSNGPVAVRDTLYWDILRLWAGIQQGIEKGKDHKPASVGVDTWGVDFGLLDKDGKLLGNPVAYRDNRTEGMMEAAFSSVAKEEIFARTGIQFMRINTLYQLLSLVKSGSAQVGAAYTFLTMPDLFNYFLTGEKASEYTISSTTQMLDARSRGWATDMLERLGIPTRILPPIVQPGTRLGEYQGIPVITPACHDTGSAVAATPTEISDYGYISSGTWSLVGLETKEPHLSAEALAANVTNEGGLYGRIRLLSNVVGLWLVQQCRNAWRKEGLNYNYDQLVTLARQAPAFQAFIDPNSPDFVIPGNYPVLVRDYCQQSEQSVPDDVGGVIRVILESLALEYRLVFERLVKVTGKEIEVLHIFGGGSKNELLNQMTANATGKPVVAGPVEATVIGNGLVQLMALGEISNLQDARQVVIQSGNVKRFEPQESAAWEEAYQRYHEVRGLVEARLTA